MANPPKPKKDLKKAGTYRKDRHENRVEDVVKPVDSTLPPPAYFTGKHLEKWIEVCEKVRGNGVLCVQDSDAIECYVRYWFILDDAITDASENGYSKETEKGYQKNPAVSVMNDAIKIVNQIGDKLGLNPRARMGIKTEKKSEGKEKTASILDHIKGGKLKVG